MFEQVTAKKLMKNSMCFQISCLFFLITLLGGITEAIVFSTNDCGYSNNYSYSCYYFYSSQQYECTSGSVKYCCSYSYSSCGDSYCRSKPYDYSTYRYYRPCYGHYIAMWVLFGISLFDLIFIVVKGVKFSRKALEENFRNGLYLQAINYQQAPQLVYIPNQLPQHNPVVSAQQNLIQEPLLC